MAAILPLLGDVMSLVEHFFPDATQGEKDKFAAFLQQDAEMFQALESQRQIDREEASNSSMFVAGWRPFIGWGLGSIVIFYAFLTLVANFSIVLGFHFIPFPPLDPMVRDIVMGMLGLNMGTRTYEKLKGIDTKHIKKG